MNAKFFDLKQDKQDRIINACLKIFALNSYDHASTDDIVKEAHISKGLLFHYFESKKGVYEFVYDFCVRYITLELSSAVDPGETSYMEIMRQCEAARMQVLKSYPYMYLFMETCKEETITEAVLVTEESKKAYEKALGTIYARADQSFMTAKKNASTLLTMLNFTLTGTMKQALLDGSFNAEDLYKTNINYISTTEKAFK